MKGEIGMNILEEWGIVPYINAHDTYTVYGGSRMSEATLDAMKEISKIFVDMEQLQRTLGEKIAAMTHNEAAYLCNGAAGGCMIAAAVCMTDGNLYRYSQLPRIVSGAKDEIIVMHCQHNAYDAALRSTGAHMIQIGDADETLAFELEGAINEHTAAIFYFDSALYRKASLPLKDTIEIAHRNHVPVVVDAAAQLPPPENFWKYTQMGADLVIFSGGKTLCGPQDSGLILGRKKLIHHCITLGAPAHGICRSCKTSREAMIGLAVAIQQYLEQDQQLQRNILDEKCHRIKEAMDKIALFRCKIVPYGPVGQTYPRVFGYLPPAYSAQAFQKAMRERRIYIGAYPQENAISISPLNLTDMDLNTVIIQLTEVASQMLSQAI